MVLAVLPAPCNHWVLGVIKSGTMEPLVWLELWKTMTVSTTDISNRLQQPIPSLPGPGLLSLSLSHNNITSEGAEALADLLLCNEALQSLVLSSNEIGSDGANSIVAALTDNRTLSALYLADVTMMLLHGAYLSHSPPFLPEPT